MRYLFPTLTRARSRHAAGRRGFTLIEAAMVTVIIGVGVVGMLELLAAGTLSNTKGTELTTAINLANNVREFTLAMPFLDPEQPTVWETKERNAMNQVDYTAFDDLLDRNDTAFC